MIKRTDKKPMPTLERTQKRQTKSTGFLLSHINDRNESTVVVAENTRDTRYTASAGQEAAIETRKRYRCKR